MSSSFVCRRMLSSGGVGGGGGAGGVEAGVGVEDGVWVGVWRTWERVRPLVTDDEGSGGGVGATLMTPGRQAPLLSLLVEGLRPAGRIICGYWRGKDVVRHRKIVCTSCHTAHITLFYLHL